MTPIEQSTLDTHFEKEKTQKELFSEQDLIEFTTLVKNKEDFAVLIKGLSNKNVLTDINTKGGLKTTIDKKILETDKKKGSEILSTTTNFEQDQNFYEMCVLGAMLKNETDKVATPDYKILAKKYFESLWGTPPEAKEEKKETSITGTYETAKANIADKTSTEIKETTTKKAGEIITNAAISISAGADMRLMKIENAKNIYNGKINTLKNTTKKFTNEKNKEEINKIIAELEDPKKINTISETNKDNQEGNRYLIGARIAEGFINALDNLVLDPEPIITLKVDWKNCVIGDTNSDIKNDRFVKININVTKENNVAGEKEKEKGQAVDQNNKPVVTGTEQGKGEKVDLNNKPVITGAEQGKGQAADQNNKPVVTGTEQGKGEKVNLNNTPVIPVNIEKAKEKPGDSPDIFIAERIRIALSKDFKRNGKGIDKDKDIKKIEMTAEENKFYITIDDKKLLFSFSSKGMEKDWNFEKDEKGELKIPEDKKKYYEAKLETTELQDKFKIYDVKETDKNITTTLNEPKTKEAFKKYYSIEDKGYTLDNNIVITKTPTGDLEKITTNVKFQLPQTILDNQKEPSTKEDIIEKIVFDKNGEIKSGSGNTYEKYRGKNQLNLLTKDKDVNDNYIKEKKNLNYNIKISGRNIIIINDEIKIDPTTKLADFGDNRMASEIENADKTKETFKEYTAGLDANFKKRQINALKGDKYQLLVIPNITGVDESKYITIPFTYTYKTKIQTKYFTFDEKNIDIPEKNRSNENYFVIDNLYYKIDIPTGEQASINPRIILDQEKTKREAVNKTSTPSKNQINEANTEKVDNNLGGTQDRNIALINNITYNEKAYEDFSINETERTIRYTRELSLNELLGYDTKNEKKFILGTIKFDGNGEIIETEDRNLKVNKKNQTLEIKNIFGRNKSLTIPFEIKNGIFTIGTNSNEKAKYIVKEFAVQKEYLKNRIYEEKALITNKINEQIKKIGTVNAAEFPGLKLATPIEGLRKESNTETIDGIQYLKGPTSTGLYYLELDNSYKDEKHSREKEFLYFKLSGKEVKLSDMNGKDIEEAYIQSNTEYKPGRGLIKIKNDLTISTIKDVEEQEKGYPVFINEPETVKTYLTKTVDEAKPTNYEKEISGQYLRIFGSSNIGHIASIPVKSKENNPDKYLYNKEGLKEITSEEMGKDLRDYDNFKNSTTLAGLTEKELKEIFMTKFEADKNIDKATNGDNIRIKNNNGKYEYWKISSKKDDEKIAFEENSISKEIQEKVIDDMKKDLSIIKSIENIQFKYRRNDEKRKVIEARNKAGNWTIKDLDKQTIKDFINKETVEEKKLNLQLLGPSKETITLDMNDGIYQKIKSKDLANGYYEDLFETKLDDTSDKEITVENENYKAYLKSDEKSKETRIIFESQVEKQNN